jgi:hypothetical protein
MNRLGPVLLAIALLLLARPTGIGQLEQAFIDSHAASLERLFGLLDPSREETDAIRRQWALGQRLEAAHALLAHLRQPPFPETALVPLDLPLNIREQAEAALSHRFFILGQWIELQRAGPFLDWHQRGPSGDKEVAWMLNRQGFLPILAQAHVETGDPRFQEAANALLLDWLAANPYPDRLTFSAPWRALEVARRLLNSWVHVFYQSDCLSPEARLLLLASMPDHADALQEHTSFWGGNHLMTEKLALLLLSIAFPVFEQAPHWQTHALAELERLFLGQSYPDGSYTELSNHYQRVVLVNARTFHRLLQGVPAQSTSIATRERLARMWDYFAGVTRPDGFGPLNNAGDAERNAAFLLSAWPEFDRPDWLYIATGGIEGESPHAPPSRLYPWAGQAILRSGYSPRDSWVYFDAGPFGTAHQHVDRLHLSAFLQGQPILVDAGRYTYQPGKWKDYFSGPHSHNVLLINGQPARQGPRRTNVPLPLSIESGTGYTFAESIGHFAPPASIAPWATSTVPWSRCLLLDDRGFLIVVDFVETHGPVDLQAIWNFDPGLTAEAALQALSLHSPLPFQRQVAVGQESPVAGFHSPDYGQRLPAAQLCYTLRANGPTALVWLIQYPTTTSSSCPHPASSTTKSTRNMNFSLRKH